MKLIFDYIINANLIISFMVIVIIGIRYVLKKYSKAYSYYLWLILFFSCIYILIPYTHIPVSQLYDGFHAADEINVYDNDVELVENDSKEVQTFEKQVGEPSLIKSIIDLKYEKIFGTDELMFKIFAVIWVIVSGVLLLYNIVLYFKIINTVRFSIKFKDNIFECDRIIMPFVQGIFRAKIYIPFNLSDDEKSFIIAHEQYHIKRKDNLAIILARLITIIFWFNPMIWLSCTYMKHDMELSCDEAVVKGCNDSERIQYVSALVNFAAKTKSFRIVAFSSKQPFLKRRVDNIIATKNKSKVFPIILIVLCFAFAIIGVSYGMENTYSYESPTQQVKY